MPTIYKPKGKKKRNKTKSRIERYEIYNTQRWKKLRALKFANNPLCELCQKEGRTTPAEDIHHIVSFMTATDPGTRYQLAYDYDNLMSLCKQCHQRQHNGEPQAVGRVET